jgi:quinol-cytochrome oxidoreductase complex cytochrome b subunit
MLKKRHLLLPVILPALFLLLSTSAHCGEKADADRHGAAAGPSGHQVEARTEQVQNNDQGMDMDAPADESARGGHAEAEGEFAHGKPGIGYIGLEKREPLPASEFDEWHEKVTKDAYKKGVIDQGRLIFFALSFIVVFLAFSKIKRLEPFSRKLRDAIDWYTLGTISGIILIGLVIPSGIVITFYYVPTSTEVYNSVEYMTTQPVLAFFRNLHNWSSEIFIWLMVLHAARTISTRTFLGNRKFIWLSGAVAAILAWVAFLSGTFMRGDQEALEGFEHMMYSFTLVPLGRIISDFFTGELALIRLTTLHIIATLFIMLIFLALHILMRKVHVLVVKRWRKGVIYSVALTIFMVVQSIFMEAPFIKGLVSGPTVAGVESTKPPWPIYFLIQGENWFGANAMVVILAAVFIPLIVFPYVIELLPLPAEKKTKTGVIAFYACTFLLILISYIGAAGKIKAHIFM